jgi:hypothetical protein
MTTETGIDPTPEPTPIHPVLSRDAFLKKERPHEFVDLTDLGYEGGFWVWRLTGTQRDELDLANLVDPGRSTEQDLSNQTAKLVALSVGDEQGNPVFTLADVVALGQTDALALRRLWTKANELSAITLEGMEALRKLLGNALSGEPGSGLPPSSGAPSRKRRRG